MIIQINDQGDKQRIDKFLTAYLENNSSLAQLTRSQVQKLIKSKKVLVNEKNISSNYIVKEGDELKVDLNFATEKQKKKSIQLDVGEITIEDNEDYIVVNKPAGIVVHPAEQINEDTLIEKIVEKYPEIKIVGDDKTRPGIVHRLDKEVSGLMVVAKNQKSFENLKKQFKKRTIDKEYLALVFGNIDKDEGVIDFPIARSKSRYKMAAIPKTQKGEINEDGREAITKFWVLNKLINYTFLKIKIITGRTHQIRAHMSAFGTPIVGDNVYTTNKLREKNRKYNLGRIFLVAHKLSFKDLSGALKTFQVELPENLKNFLKEAK